MKVALPVWQGYVSSVFDFAHKLLVIELDNEEEKDRQEIVLFEQSDLERVTMLKQLDIGVLICGAISKPLAELIMASGIQVFPFVKGSTANIVTAYKTGQLSQPQYTLPGFWPGARSSFHRRRYRKGRCR